jgi:hypothetical protein
MIVLDEHLTGHNIKQNIAKWYRGKVCFIDELRPKSVVKDEGIPELLIKQKYPTFLTLDEKDFWGKIEAHSKYCIICFNWDDSRIPEISDTLRSLFKKDEFTTKAIRMGKVFRISDIEIRFYSASEKAVKCIKWE